METTSGLRGKPDFENINRFLTSAFTHSSTNGAAIKGAVMRAENLETEGHDSQSAVSNFIFEYPSNALSCFPN